jgi:hypothetical protein
MYDLDFIYTYFYRYAGLTKLPDEIDPKLLFNVSFDIESSDIKLYILDKSQRFAYKISSSGVSKQYSGADPEFGAQPQRLNHFLNVQVDYRQVTIDAVEGDNYYVYMEDAKGEQYQQFIDSYCQRYAITVEQLLKKVSQINHRSFQNLEQCCSARAISMLRIPLDGSESKVYAQPFLYGEGIPINQRSMQFLLKLFGCDTRALKTKLKQAWVVSDLKSNRTLLVTQHHDLLHSL